MDQLIVFQKVTSRVVIRQLVLIAISNRIQSVLPPTSQTARCCLDFYSLENIFPHEKTPKWNSSSIPAAARMLEAAAWPQQLLGSSFSQLSEIISCPQGRQMHLLVPGLLLSFFHYQAGLVLKRPYPACPSNRADSFI